MRTDDERKSDQELQERIEKKLGKKLGHAIPIVDRNRPIENNFEFKAIDRETLKEPLKDIDMAEYELWRKFNNRHERQFRGQDAYLIDEPGISDEEIKRRIAYNNASLRKITLDQVKEHPELFNDSDS